jgi:hypothetical protein
MTVNDKSIKNVLDQTEAYFMPPCDHYYVTCPQYGTAPLALLMPVAWTSISEESSTHSTPTTPTDKHQRHSSVNYQSVNYHQTD